jgi:hypothetical protein
VGDSELDSPVLKALGRVVAGRGRGGSLALSDKGQALRASLDGKRASDPAQATSAGPLEAAAPKPKAEDQDLADTRWGSTSTQGV